jgi:hypothetical protein
VETSGINSGNVQTHTGLTGLHNKPIGCSATGAYVPGPEEEEEEEEKKKKTMDIQNVQESHFSGKQRSDCSHCPNYFHIFCW